MKDNLILPEHFPGQNKDDLKVATKRRENYAVARDLQAKEFNEAITIRLAKEKEKHE